MGVELGLGDVEGEFLVLEGWLHGVGSPVAVLGLLGLVGFLMLLSLLLLLLGLLLQNHALGQDGSRRVDKDGAFLLKHARLGYNLV